MAGNYMDAPNYRLPWDSDGSVLTFISANGEVVAGTGTERRTINSESDSGVSPPTNTPTVAVVFPEPIDITAVFASHDAEGSTITWTVQLSKDTTNGYDGTWTTIHSGLALPTVVRPLYREESRLIWLNSGAVANGVRGVRFRSSSYQTGTPSWTMNAIHVYGSPSASASKDRIAFWHPTNNAQVSPSYLDWGNVPRSSSATRQFRLKNLSNTLDAVDLEMQIESLFPGVPSVAGMHLLSEDGGNTFTNLIQIPSLSAGSISPIYQIRRVVPASASLGVWAARIIVEVAAWE